MWLKNEKFKGPSEKKYDMNYDNRNFHKELLGYGRRTMRADTQLPMYAELNIT
jgi:hypothetical protein